MHARAPFAQIHIRRTCTRWNDAAHIRSNLKLAVPICLNRHNFATEHSPVRNEIDRCGGRPGAAKTKETPSDSQRVPDAKELGKRWRFFPTYAEV
jgi:hypothetical protein